MERNYIAFISYCHAPLDSAVAEHLHSMIESYTIPPGLRRGKRRKLGLVFRDKEELAASGDLSRDICRALDASEFLIVVCTPKTPGSVWVEREIQYFLRSHDRSHVLAVLAEGEPKQSFPKALTHTARNGSGAEMETEPLAVDIRTDGIHSAVRNLKAERKRLFAAILGCPYDALVHRQQRRFLRQTAVVTAFCVAAACLAAALWANTPQISQNSKMPEVENTFVRYQGTQQKSEDGVMSIMQTAATSIYDQSDNPPGAENDIFVQETEGATVPIGKTAAADSYDQSGNPPGAEEDTSTQDQQTLQETEGAQISIGDIVIFGTYEQDNNRQNGAEDIQWIVIAQRDDRIMLISKECLDSKPYHDTLEPITWEYCSLRKWLNQDFFQTAFTGEEQDRIITVTNENPPHDRAKTSSGRSTTDRVFILSRQEAQELFSTYASRKAAPTNYAVAQGAYQNENNLMGWWWLRTTSYKLDHVSYATSGGDVSSEGRQVIRKDAAVRPVIWITVD